MSIPEVLILDIKYNISKENLEKTLSVNVAVDEISLNKFNDSRSQDEKIFVENIQEFISNITVINENNVFSHKLNLSEETKLKYDLVKDFIKIDIDSFEGSFKRLIHFCPEFGNLMSNKNYEEIVNKYYLKMSKNKIENEIGKENFIELSGPNSKFNVIYNTLLQNPIKNLKNNILPTYNSEEDKFFNITEGQSFKYLTYLSDETLWPIPKNSNNEVIKVDSLTVTLRYLTFDELSAFRNDLLGNDEYLNNLGKIITTEEINLQFERSFEADWSTENLKQTVGLIKTNILPKFYLNNKKEISLSKPGKTNDFLMKAFFGVNNKFFEEKLYINKNDVSIEN